MEDFLNDLGDIISGSEMDTKGENLRLWKFDSKY